MAETGEFAAPAPRAPGQVVRLPRLADVDLPDDATMFAHTRRLPPVPPARPRP